MKPINVTFDAGQPLHHRKILCCDAQDLLLTVRQVRLTWEVGVGHVEATKGITVVPDSGVLAAPNRSGVMRSPYSRDLTTRTDDSPVRLASIRAITWGVHDNGRGYPFGRRKFTISFEATASLVDHGWQLVKFIDLVWLASLIFLLDQDPFLLHLVRLGRTYLQNCRFRWLPFKQGCSITELRRHLCVLYINIK